MQKIISVLFLIVSCFSIGQLTAQVYSNKLVGEKNAEVIDSLKLADYPYALPIWGDKATKLGFDLPYSAGLSVQYFWQESDIIIEDLMVGFNNGPMYDLDGLVRFDDARATAAALTVRPDIWLFPFLNVYGILGRSGASTAVGFGVWVPDSSNTSREVFSYDTRVDFQATSIGFGLTPTIGVGGGFLALDLNVAWTDVPQLKNPARTFVFGPRFGKNFKLKKPQNSVAVWVGGFRVHLNSETDGSINLNEVISAGELNEKIDAGYAKIEDVQMQVDTWWEDLSSIEQNNPVNKAKYEAANSALERASEFLVAAEGAINTAANSTVQYAMNKYPKDMWNFIVGSQYQFNKHWMIRGEVGFLGSRVQALTGVQYRFGL
ncbi:MAG: hypothetical protein SFV52_13905 [Saprospiraceae bacterium]|nr:hypothetical protein [Saprospiraceae bacterium]